MNNITYTDGIIKVVLNTTTHKVVLDKIIYETDFSLYTKYGFKNIAVSGQNNVVAETKEDTLNLVAGNNITLTTDNINDSITISAGASYSDEQAQDAIGNILVDSSTIDFTYNHDTPSITASIIQSAINTGSINNNAGFITIDSVTKSQVGLSNVQNIDTTTTTNITDSIDKRFITDNERINWNNAYSSLGDIQAALIAINGV